MFQLFKADSFHRIQTLNPVIYLCILILASCAGTRQAEKFPNPDLSFFALKGPVKEYSMIVTTGDLDAEKVSFAGYKHIGGFLTYTFDTAGNILEVNTNYNNSDFPKAKPAPKRVRTKDTLWIDMTTRDEIYWEKYGRHGDTITRIIYDKLDMESIQYHSESIKRFVYNVQGRWLGFSTGQNDSLSYERQQYKPVPNADGLDSLVYVVSGNGSAARRDKMYTIRYYDFDSHGNWTKRQIKKYISHIGYGYAMNTITEMRQILYY